MELWIRSQQKEMLIKATDIRLKYSDTAKDNLFFITCNDTKIAMYKSRERALEVLDEIQEFIENKGKIKITQDINEITSEVEDAKRVYQMPKE